MYPIDLYKLLRKLKKSFIPAEQIELMKEFIIESWNSEILEARCYLWLPALKDPDNITLVINLSIVSKAERVGKGARLWFDDKDKETKDVVVDFETLAGLLKRFAVIRVGTDLLVHVDEIKGHHIVLKRVHLHSGEIILLDDEAMKVYQKDMDLWNAMNYNDPDAEDYGFNDFENDDED